MLRSIMAYIVAPFPAALFQALVVALWPKPGLGVFANPSSMFVAICLLFWGLGLLGVPIAWVLRRRNLLDLRHFAALGAVTMLLPIATLEIATFLRGALTLYAATYNLLFFGLGGWTAGALFWRLTRPDRRSAPAR